jgi:hypothetical protein
VKSLAGMLDDGEFKSPDDFPGFLAAASYGSKSEILKSLIDDDVLNLSDTVRQRMSNLTAEESKGLNSWTTSGEDVDNAIAQLLTDYWLCCEFTDMATSWIRTQASHLKYADESAVQRFRGKERAVNAHLDELTAALERQPDHDARMSIADAVRAAVRKIIDGSGGNTLTAEEDEIAE